MLPKQFVPLLLLGFVLQTARGGIVFSDDFSYPDGSLTTVSSGRWKCHSGTTGQVHVAQGKIYLSQRKTEDVNAPFPGGGIGPIESLSLYAAFNFSFSALPTGSEPAYFAHFKDAAATTGMRCRIFVSTNAAAAGLFRIGIAAAASAPTAVLSTDLRLNTTYRLVCRMLLADNVSTLWLNPSAESNPGATSTDSTAAKAAAGLAFRQSLTGGNGMGELSIDDVVVATTFQELQLGRAPVILIAPEDQRAVAGGDVTFRVKVTGTEPFAYRWWCNGVQLPAAGGPVLVLHGIALADAGMYQVEVSNRAGSVMSASATLTVDKAPLILRLSQNEPGTILLRWTAEPDQTYSLWTADEVTSEFAILVSDLYFTEGIGTYQETVASGPVRFYRVCSP
jgi:hypothetical protein